MIESTVSGLVTGATYAILAVCVVVLHRLVGVLNIGMAAIGAFGAYSCYTLLAQGVPWAAALLLGIGIAVLIAVGAGWIFARWFVPLTPTLGAVLSVVLLVIVLTAGFRVFGDSPRVMPSLIPHVSLNLLGVHVSLATLVAVAATLATAFGITLLLNNTTLGLQLLALSERPDTAQLMGINAQEMSVLVWGATGALATLALVLVAPTRNPTFETMSFFIVPALAAALLGAFSSVWVATFAGLGIGAIEGLGARLPLISEYRGAVPFIIIIVTLIWMRRREVWDVAR